MPRLTILPSERETHPYYAPCDRHNRQYIPLPNTRYLLTTLLSFHPSISSQLNNNNNNSLPPRVVLYFSLCVHHRPRLLVLCARTTHYRQSFVSFTFSLSHTPCRTRHSLSVSVSVALLRSSPPLLSLPTTTNTFPIEKPYRDRNRYLGLFIPPRLFSSTVRDKEYISLVQNWTDKD